MYGHHTGLAERVQEKQDGCNAAPGSGACQMLTVSSSTSYKSRVSLAAQSRAVSVVERCSPNFVHDNSQWTSGLWTASLYMYTQAIHATHEWSMEVVHYQLLSIISPLCTVIKAQRHNGFGRLQRIRRDRDVSKMYLLPCHLRYG